MEMTPERLTELGISEEDLKDPEKVKELAEKFEAENKAKANEEAESKDDKILNDQLGRLAKAISKREKVEKPDNQEPSKTLSELDVDNLVFAKTKGLNEKQIQALQDLTALPQFKGKTFEQINSSKIAQFQLKEIQNEIDAENELDTEGEGAVTTQKELYNEFAESGKVPDGAKAQEAIADKFLDQHNIA